MKLKRLSVLLLAALLLLGCGCGLRVVEKPVETDVPVLAPQATPVPTPEPSAAPEPDNPPEPTVSPSPDGEPEPTEEPTPDGGYRRGLVHYDELEYQRPDCDAIQAQIGAIQAMLTDGTDSEAIREAYDALEDAFHQITTAYSLASIFSSRDLNDSYYSDETEYLTTRSDELAVACTLLEVAIYESPHRDTVFYDWTEEDFEYLRIAENLYDDEYVRLDTRVEELINAYWDAMTNTTISYDGQTLSMEELEGLDVDESTYYVLMNDYYAAVNQKVGELYLELVSVKKQIAAKAGYTDFAAFSYDFDYARDYTLEDSQALWSYVKEYVVREMRQLYSGMRFEEYRGLMQAMSAKNQLSRRQSYIEDYVTEVSPDMLEAYNYLVEYQLSLLTTDAGSQSGAYTTFLPGYDMPFIYLHETGGYGDMLTFIHEFGHFYASYLGGSDAAENASLDVSEICSQANELLFLPYLREYMPEDTYLGVMKYQLYTSLMSLVDGCLYDEFQQYVYSHELTTVEELNEAYREISRSYGIGDDAYYVDLGYVWVDVLHNFECPMYYISYATSMVPALELLELSQTDREEALRVYNNIVRSDPDLTFAEVLEENGLQPVFSEETIAAVVNGVVDFTGVGDHVTVD